MGTSRESVIRYSIETYNNMLNIYASHSSTTMGAMFLVGMVLGKSERGVYHHFCKNSAGAMGGPEPFAYGLFSVFRIIAAIAPAASVNLLLYEYGYFPTPPHQTPGEESYFTSVYMRLMLAQIFPTISLGIFWKRCT